MPVEMLLSSRFMCIRVYVFGMGSREILRRLKSDGWFEVARKGSHIQLKHSAEKGRVTVPHPKRDLPKGTVRSIEKQAGIRLL